MSASRTHRMDGFARRMALAWVVSGPLLCCAPSPHDLAARGDVERLAERLDEDPDLIADRNDLDKTPLHYAATYGKPESIELLLMRGADPNAADRTGMTPLHCAATLNRVREAELLLGAGGRIDARDAFGDTPLHTAAMHGQMGFVEFLLARGADPNVKNNEGLTPAELARRHRKADVADRLAASAGSGLR